MGDPTPSLGAALNRAIKEPCVIRVAFNAGMPDALGSPMNRLLHRNYAGSGDSRPYP